MTTKKIIKVYDLMYLFEDNYSLLLVLRQIYSFLYFNKIKIDKKNRND